uniref:Uncharacterized protein n=1 Tax=Pyramimonas obovata TaxID=1411642 RepID=A0A7S0RCL4_9CHLO|mmetsp:Transcript_31017/g.67758  ORF Transcript_31017/g.67758 Transcript_31017/m.67758 type:complete len:556 (+) Transcript_31017:262-1929(+)
MPSSIECKEGSLVLRISKPGGIGLLACLVLIFVYKDVMELLQFTLDPPHSTHDHASEAEETVHNASGHPRRSGPSFPVSPPPPPPPSPNPPRPPPIASLYTAYEWDYPFDPKQETFREADDALPLHPPSSERRPARPKAVLLTHDNRDWSKTRNYITYLQLWNFLYSQRHDLHFVYYKMIKGEILNEPVDGTTRGALAVENMNRLLPPAFQVPLDYSQEHCEPPPPGYETMMEMGCRGPDGCYIWNSWCKIKAMRHAMALFPETEYFLYMDSDATVGPEYAHISIARYAQHMEQLQHFSFESRPVAFGQELGGLGWNGYCKKMWAANLTCFNSGVVLAKRTDAAKAVLERWWELSTAVAARCNDPSAVLAPNQIAAPPGSAAANRAPVWMSEFACQHAGKFYTNSLRWRWPGEQPSMGAMHADPQWNQHIQVAWPDEPQYYWNLRHKRSRRPPPFVGPLGVDCFAHYPQAHCFVQHFFVSSQMKVEESVYVRTAVLQDLRTCLRVRRLLPAAAAAALCGSEEDDSPPQWASTDEMARMDQLAALLMPHVDQLDIA